MALPTVKLQGDYLKAEEDLGKSNGLLHQTQTHDSQFVFQWRAFLESYRTSNTAAIVDYRKTSEANDDWDGMRECAL